MKENNFPLVSIALCTYNGEKFLIEQLDSLVDQSYMNIEIIICDDCSNDSTYGIINDYVTNTENIKFFKNTRNLGYVKNYEKAISLCQGDFIALSDQDDIWEKRKIEILMKEIGENLLIHSDAALIDENGNIIADSYTDSCKDNIGFFKTPYNYFWGML